MVATCRSRRPLGPSEAQAQANGSRPAVAQRPSLHTCPVGTVYCAHRRRNSCCCCRRRRCPPPLLLQPPLLPLPPLLQPPLLPPPLLPPLLLLSASLLAKMIVDARRRTWPPRQLPYSCCTVAAQLVTTKEGAACPHSHRRSRSKAGCGTSRWLNDIAPESAKLQGMATHCTVRGTST